MSAYSAYADVLGSHPYKGCIGTVRLTSQNINDARDADSDPRHGGGFYSAFTIVKRVKPLLQGTGRYQDCDVVISNFTSGENIIIANLSNPELERPVDREIYVLGWPPEIQYPCPYSMPSAYSLPRFRSLRNWRIGIPKKGDIYIMFFRGNEKFMMSEDRPPEQVSGLEPVQAVDKFYTISDYPQVFRLAVATHDNFDQVLRSIEQSELGLFAEELPLSRTID